MLKIFTEILLFKLLQEKCKRLDMQQGKGAQRGALIKPLENRKICKENTYAIKLYHT